MRIQSSILNLGFAMLGQNLGLLVSFFARIVFIQTLGTEYLGLSGLFTNILSVLALVELGIGPAMSYSLYKPIAEKDTEKIKSLMRIFKKAYIFIGIVILILGIMITPFLGYFIKSIPNIPNINFIFLLFVTDSAISYFYSYKRALIISDQKRYIATIYRYSFFIGLNIIQILILMWTHNFILFLVCQITFTIGENILISRKADKLYPYLNDKNVNRLDKITIHEISKNVRALIYHKLGTIVVNATDNIIISKFIGLIGVGIYSNYLLIIYALNLLISQIFMSITASIGNLGAVEAEDKKKFIFDVVFFMNFWIYGFASICLVILINPFIILWIGNDFILDFPIVLVIILNFFLTGMRKGVLTFREALGLYWYDRYKPIFEAVINLVASLILVKELGIMGVLLGTTISTLTTCVWVEPYILYKYGLKSSVWPFFKKYFLYSAVTFITCLITVSFANLFQEENITIISFIIKFTICLVIPNIIFFLFFSKSIEFKYLYNVFKHHILINIKKIMI